VLELYFSPFACSLASRIALLEAGIEARYRRVDLKTKRVLDEDADFLAVSPKGQVPVLRFEDGTALTEGAAVLQRIADLKPESQLAPPPENALRYALQEWLNFVATEIHKAFLYPTFLWDTPDGVRAHARTRIPRTLDVVAGHLKQSPHLLCERFSVADAYLIWALTLMPLAGIDLAGWPALGAYLDRMQRRPSVADALATEQSLLQARSVEEDPS
jgi:glutathione S-transferase